VQISIGVLRTVALAVGFGAVCVCLPHAQQAAGGVQTPAVPPATEGTSAISGVVTDGTTHQPIAGVMVYLGFQGRGAVGRLSRQLSDEKGRFVFTDLPAGNNYFINASKFGYLEGHHGVGAGGLLGGLITLTDGQWYSDANVTMQRPAAISGRVADEHGDPAVGVFVRVLSRIPVAGRLRIASGQTAKTDDRGVYRLADLTPGRYVVQVVSVQQSVAASMTAAELAGIPPDQIVAGRAVPDPPAAVDFGLASRLVVGRYPLPPPASNGQPQTYPAAFYPGAARLDDASIIEVRAGDERGGVDFSLHPVAASSISGVVSGPADVLPGLVVRLLPEGLEELGSGSEVATATLGVDGRFTLFNVPAGSYVLDIRRTISELQYRSPLATSPAALPVTPGTGMAGSSSGSILSGPSGTYYSTRLGRGNAAYFARMSVSVGTSPVNDLLVTLRRGWSIRGKFVMESGEAPNLPALTPVHAEPADGNMALGLFTATQQARNTFAIEGLLGGAYLLRFISVGTGSVMSVTSDGEDHRFKPFDGSSGRDFDVVVTVIDKRTDLSGRAADAQGAQVRNAIVIAFPVEREQWTNYGLSPARLKGSPTSSSGTYRFQSLPAGEYYLVAVPADQGDAWQDPAKLAVLARSAARVTLAWGDVKTQNVTVIKFP
jgi:hypothetical protein